MNLDQAISQGQLHWVPGPALAVGITRLLACSGYEGYFQQLIHHRGHHAQPHGICERFPAPATRRQHHQPLNAQQA